jgi:hypothetical protein
MVQHRACIASVVIASLLTWAPSTYASTASSAVSVDEGFDDARTLPSLAWLVVNNSDAGGPQNQAWFQGSADEFDSYDGAENAYIGANYLETASNGTISSWLISPPLTLDGASLSFYTRGGGAGYADRLQVRLCSGNDCTNVGSGSGDVGDFTTLLLDINASYEPTGYPSDWTQETVEDLGAVGVGRIALRYFVEDAGIGGTRGDFVGIDRLSFGNEGSSTAPTAAAFYVPATVHSGGMTTIVFALSNPNDAPMHVTAPLVHNLPQGVAVAARPNEFSTCADLALVATAGSTAIELDNATISPTAGCIFAIDVVASDVGEFMDTIEAGELSTDQGSNSLASNAPVTVLDATNINGLLYSTAVSHEVQESNSGTSYDMVDYTFDDTGSTDAPYDVNVFAYDPGDAIAFEGIGANHVRVVVDAAGEVAALKPTQEVSGARTFSDSGGAAISESEWLSGTDAYVGVSFDCDGRLEYPVASVTCYGYLHLRTTAPAGFPAFVIDSAFNGDGGPIIIPAAEDDAIFASGFE